MSPSSAIVVPSTPVTITAANAAHPFCGVAVLQDAKSTVFASSTENLPSSATLFVHCACEYGPLPLCLRKSGGGKFPAVGSSFSDTGSAARTLAARGRDPVPAAVGSLMQALTRNGSATIAGGSRVKRIVIRSSGPGITTRVLENQTPSHQFGSSAIAGVAFVTGGAASDYEIPRSASFGKKAPCPDSPLSLEQQRYRPVVHQLDLHHRAELPRLDLDTTAALTQQGHEAFVQGDRHGRRRGVDKAGAAPLAGIAVERELRDDEDAATDVGEIAVHFAFVVSEDAQTKNLFGHPRQLCIGVGRRETGEHEKAGPDLSGNPAFHPNLRTLDPLEDDSHSTVTLFAKFRG